ncbi:DEAD/DEAH box helicase family protein [Candidatus Pacearchaeota archaeon]|nr:DEAD/DEAH box helicase family protein [Candidatus Pacearchaeota archaeon]
MGRIIFDSSGKLASVDGKHIEKEKDKKKKEKFNHNNKLDNNSGEDINQDYSKQDLDEKFGNFKKFNIGSDTRLNDYKKENKTNEYNFGLLDNEKIERVGWDNKGPSNFNNRRFDKKDEFSDESLKTIRNNFSNRFNKKLNKNYNSDEDNESDFEQSKIELKKVDSLSFLKDNSIDVSTYNYDMDDLKNKYWNFYSDNKFLKPLKFSNKKTQEDIVKEVVKLIKSGEKIIFLKGVCGSGKSAIALNIARSIGKTAIVVPLKSLQKQYEDDYSKKKYLIKKDLKKLIIASITGKDNHDSIYKPGISCADKNLPENIKITQKNSLDVMKYFDSNDFNDNRESSEIKDIKRTWIAPANPYWSPILPSEFEITNLKDAKKYKYEGCNGKEFIFYHRKSGCSYYDQYLAYIYADVLIYNSAKYKSELLLYKKPNTKVDIIDEADEFLDSLFNQKEINLKRFYDSLIEIKTESTEATKLKSKIIRLLELEFNNNDNITEFENKQLSDDDIKRIDKTNLSEIFKILLKENDLVAEISIEELNYSNNVIDIVKSFSETIDDIFISYKIINDNLIINLVTSDLSGCINEITSKNNAMIFMSGTLHSKEVITNLLGIKDYKIVEAETINQGNIEIIMTGREFDCRYSSFSQDRFAREEYLFSISECIKKAKLPALIHVNAFKDLPTNEELSQTGINNLISCDNLINNQKIDKLGEQINRFKNKEIDKIFTTKCSRGIDFPGDICNSVLFTKYPNPNINNMFWKILKKTYPNHFWSFYKDKAKREFLQRIYRALRSTNDHIYVLSPDIRVLNAVRELQMKKF